MKKRHVTDIKTCCPRSRKSVIFGVVILVCFILAAGNSLAGQEKKEKTVTWKSEPEKVKIDDDLSYIYQQDTSSRLTALHILVKGGKRAVPPKQRGLAFLTTRLAVELPELNRIWRLMELGSTLYYHVEGDFLIISIRSLSEHLDETLDIILQGIKNPLFSGIRIENVKKYMEHRGKGEDDSPEQLMELTFFNTFFNAAANTYAGSIFGDPETLANIKKKDIQDFYDRCFNSANMIITVCSDLEKTALTPIMTKHFTDLPTGEPVKTKPVQVVIPEKKELFLGKNTRQVLISYGALLPRMSRGDYVSMVMLENLLGKGIGSKLWPLRAQKELAYSLDTRFIQMQDAGLLIILLRTDSDKRREARQALKDLLVNIHTAGFTMEDLDTARKLSKADFLRDNETKERRVRTLSYFEAMGVGIDFFTGFFSQMDQVTLEDFNAFLKKVLNPAQLLEVVIGPEVPEVPGVSGEAGESGESVESEESEEKVPEKAGSTGSKI